MNVNKFLKTLTPAEADHFFRRQLSEYEVCPGPASAIYGPTLRRRHAWLDAPTQQTGSISWLFPNIWTPNILQTQNTFLDPTYPYNERTHDEMHYAPWPFLGESARVVTKTFWLGRFDLARNCLAITDPLVATQIMFACYADSAEAIRRLSNQHSRDQLQSESPCVRLKRSSEIRDCPVGEMNAYAYCKYFVFDLPLEDYEWQMHLVDMSLSRSTHYCGLLPTWQQRMKECEERRPRFKQLEFVAKGLDLQFRFELDQTKVYLFKTVDCEEQGQPQPELAVAVFDLITQTFEDALSYLANYHSTHAD